MYGALCLGQRTKRDCAVVVIIIGKWIVLSFPLCPFCLAVQRALTNNIMEPCGLVSGTPVLHIQIIGDLCTVLSIT